MMMMMKKKKTSSKEQGMNEQQKPRPEFLALAESCGAVLTGSPDGKVAVSLVFTPAAWRKFDRASRAANVPQTVYQLSPTDIYDFAGWLTTRKVSMQVGSSHEAAQMAEAVGEYLKTYPERFAAAPACTCPSGDGSLRWPCPEHPAPAPEAAKPCLIEGKCKHVNWCSEVYCQEHCKFVKEAAPAQAQQAAEPLPCPFCGGKCDPTGWIGTDEPISGPECEDCGATAESVEAWNKRATKAKPEAQQPTNEQIDRAITELGLDYLANIETNRDVMRELCKRASGEKPTPPTTNQKAT